MTYSLGYSSRYLKSARQLCQKMLKRYAVIEEAALPVPRYRGFHVRPSTLVAKIVQHYGSEVKMKLGDETYDAGAPIDLFRPMKKSMLKNAAASPWIYRALPLQSRANRYRKQSAQYRF